METLVARGGTTFEQTVLGVSSIVTVDPENVKALLATQFNDFALGLRHDTFYPLLGDGIFTLDGPGWSHSRAMLRPQFARDQVRWNIVGCMDQRI
jgi:cytochrome P450